MDFPALVGQGDALQRNEKVKEQGISPLRSHIPPVSGIYTTAPGEIPGRPECLPGIITPWFWS